MSYVFDSIDFQNYLLEKSTKFRVDGLSIWFNSIPLPVDLFDKLFDDSSQHFKLYLDHVVAAVILGSAIEHDFAPDLSLKEFPSNQRVDDHRDQLQAALEREIRESFRLYDDFVSDTSDYLGIEDYQIHVPALMQALSHQGKKYSRIYCPAEIKDKIKASFPDILKDFAKSNGDMFGNVIADQLKIYRSGFNDAFASIFSRLLDFKICECSGVLSSRPKITLIGNTSTDDIEITKKFIYERTSDGSLWEPYFDGEYKVKLNPAHPYSKKLPEYNESTKFFYEFLVKISEYEAQLDDHKDLKSIESMRSIVSRNLWIESDS
jgi:hypothetical protein